MNKIDKHFHISSTSDNMDIALFKDDTGDVLVDGNVWMNLNIYTGVKFYYYKNGVMTTLGAFPLPSV